MENLFNKFSDFITSKDTKKVDKFFYLSLVVLSLFFIDYSLNISYKYQINSKLNTLKEIKEAEEKFKDETGFSKELTIMKQELMNEKHYYDILFTRDKNTDNSTSFITAKEHKNSSAFFQFTSSTITLLPLTIIIFIGFIYETKSKDWSRLHLWIILLAISILGMFASYSVLNNLPVILENVTYNYIVNFFISLVIAQALGRLAKMFLERKNEEIYQNTRL